MAEQRQLPDWALTGDRGRYDFLAWMLECRKSPEWEQGPVWVTYSVEPHIVRSDDGWQAVSRWMIPGMMALVLPEKADPGIFPLKPDTQLLIFEEPQFGRRDTYERDDNARKSGHPARIVLVDKPIHRSSTDLDADSDRSEAQRQCELYRSAGKDAVCVQPPLNGEGGPVLVVLNGRETDSQRWKRQLCSQLDSIGLRMEWMAEAPEEFSLDESVVYQCVYSFESFKAAGQKSIWLAYVSRMENVLFDARLSDFLEKAELYYAQFGLTGLLKPPFWNAEKDRQLREKRLREAYRQAVQNPVLAEKKLDSITEEEYNRQVAREKLIGKMDAAVKNYLKNTAPLILQNYAQERYEQIRGRLK